MNYHEFENMGFLIISGSLGGLVPDLLAELSIERCGSSPGQSFFPRGILNVMRWSYKELFLFSIVENDDDNADQDCRKKRRRILGPEFGSIDLNSDEGKKLLAAKSQHVGAVKAVSTIVNVTFVINEPES